MYCKYDQQLNYICVIARKSRDDVVRYFFNEREFSEAEMLKVINMQSFV